MKNNIYVIGSSNTDMVIKSDSIPKPGETVIGGKFYTFQGGKGANQAVAASKLGGKVTFICRVGDDSFGKNSIRQYEAHGINTEFIGVEENEHTGVALIMVDKKGENLISVSSGANSRIKIQDVSFLDNKLTNDDIVLTQLEIPIEVVKYLIDICSKKNVKLILNPAPFQRLEDKYLKKVHTITPNISETKYLTEIEVNDIDSSKLASQKLLDKGIKNVIITMGSNGVFFMSEKQMGHIKAENVKAIDTTAAGDTFNGALAKAFSCDLDLVKSIKFSNAAAAFSVTRLGAQDSIPKLNELDKKFQNYVYS